MTTAVMTTEASRQALGEGEFGTGWQRWNLQAWLDWILARILMGRISDVIPKTYMPILRLVCPDPAKADADYARILTLRETVRFFDSPREKWRKLYGGYIRELEWVLGELRQHFPPREYQELAVDIMARRIQDCLGPFLPKLEKDARGGVAAAVPPRAIGREPDFVAGKAARAMEKAIKGPIVRWFLNNLNPAGFMVGPVELEMQPNGELKMFIPRCWMHTAPCEGRTQDQACVQTCKGACERVFGPDSAAPMIFEPHLPDYSCTLWIKLGPGEFESDAIHRARHPANKPD